MVLILSRSSGSRMFAAQGKEAPPTPWGITFGSKHEKNLVELTQRRSWKNKSFQRECKPRPNMWQVGHRTWPHPGGEMRVTQALLPRHMADNHLQASFALDSELPICPGVYTVDSEGLRLQVTVGFRERQRLTFAKPFMPPISVLRN